MIVAPLPPHEEERLLMLRALAILDTPPEAVFDHLTQLAAELLQAPMALVSLVDAQRQWFKSRVGIDGCETARDLAFCAHALLSAGPMVVEDALQDERFADHPMVLGEPFVRAYLGVPLRSLQGHALGTLCVVDQVPRRFSAHQLATVQRLAALAERELQHRERALHAQEAAQAGVQAIHDSQALYQATFEQAAIGIAIVGLDGRWQRFNRTLCEVLGRDAEELASLTFQEITHPDDLDLDLGLVRQLLDGARDRYTLEKRYLRPDGGTVWAQLTVRLVRQGGEPAYFIAVIEDISARREAQEALRQMQQHLEQRVQERTAELALLHRQVEALAYQDSLTGLPNRRLLLDRLGQAMARCRRAGGRVAVCFIDLNGFKPVNDRHGHEAGDQVLKVVAERLQGLLREEDTVARLGGDEFVLALTQLGSAESLAPVLARVRQAFEAPVPLDNGALVSLGASLGVAWYPALDGEGAGSAEELIASADAAMYGMKHALPGRAAVAAA